MPEEGSEPKQSMPMRPSGRRFWTRRWFLRSMFAAGFASATTGLYAIKVEPHWVEWTRRRMEFENLPSRLSGKLLLQVSDLHIGPHVDTSYVREMLARAATLDPDWVVFTGDFVTWRGDWVLSELDRVLDGTVRGRLGTFAVFGNHDYGRRWNDAGIARLIEEGLKRHGITLLRNRWVASNGVVFAGVEDYWSKQYNIWQALAGRPAGPTVMLAHNPDLVHMEGWGDFRGWILSGHTHGGQVKLPLIGTPIVPVTDRRLVAGEYDVGPGRKLYVNRGLGHSIPIRFRVRPEVTLFTLATAPSA